MTRRFSDLITKDLKPAVIAGWEAERAKTLAELAASDAACEQEIQARADLVNAALAKIEERGVLIDACEWRNQVWWQLPGIHDGYAVKLGSNGSVLVQQSSSSWMDEGWLISLDDDEGHNWLVTKDYRHDYPYADIEYLVAAIRALQAFVAD